MVTKEQIKDIFTRLEEWRTPKYITPEIQRKVYDILFDEEKTEYFKKGLEANNIHETIDALCDLVVITINAFADMINLEDFEDIYSNSFYGDSLRTKADFYSYIAYICSCLEDHNHLFAKEAIANSSLEFIADCLHEIELFGYNPYLAMNECIKEISARTQDEEQCKKWEFIIANGGTPNEKWKKDQRKEVQASWYKANYDNAKL